MKKQKNTTKNGKTPKNRRAKSKYPALNKGLNLSSRKDYIEADYIDGVRDKDGNVVIPPMNEEEKQWLNDFYEETIITNFSHHPEIKRLNRKKKLIIEDETVQLLIDQVKNLEKDKANNRKQIKDLKEIIKITKKQNEETYADELYEIEKELQELRDEHLLYPDKEDHKQFYNANNARNSCIFNRSRMMNKLFDLDADEFESFMANKAQNEDTEESLIFGLEREQYEEAEERIENIMDEVKTYIKKKSKS